MKKIMLMAFAIGAFVFTSCSDDDDGGSSCTDLANNYHVAVEAYTEDPSDENCTELAAAAEAYQDSDCEGSGAVQVIPCDE